ncbi:MAG: hypothetical protein C0485_04250 [Pirellula sp.]|nr:hypothetical protein [Pirellula sp.]
MANEPLWAADAKIIEIEPRDGELGADLVRAGFENYLAVVSSPEVAAAIEQQNSNLCGKVAANADARRIRRNNADVMVLSGWTPLALAIWRNIRHAEWIAVPLQIHPAVGAAWFIAAVRRLLGHVEPTRIASFPDAERKLLVWRNRRRTTAGARRYIPYRLGVKGFLQQLQDDQRKHVVLRWFESLPAVMPGEDLDLLIDDAELTEVQRCLDSGPGLQPVDLYTHTGLPGTDFRSLPYYPPTMARKLLDEAHEHRRLCRVPSPEHHFLSLAYHALYHKGVSSGLPTSEAADIAGARGDHDYAAILRGLGEEAGYHGPITLEALDAYLAEKGWRPSHDMMARLARHNKWLRTRLANETESDADNGLAVFLLRERGLQRGGVARAKRLLEEVGFCIAEARELEPSEAAVAAQVVRGGNWGPGPWPESGGLPAAIIVAYDRDPLPLNRRQRKKYPFAVNARTFCKDRIRDEFNNNIPDHEHCNVVHSSDNGHEALEYIRAICRERADDVIEKVTRVKMHQDAVSGVVADITKSGRRAKIEVVRHEDRLVVKKTFKPQMLHFLEREVRFLTELGGKVSSVPPLVARGETWFMIPFYRDVLAYRRSSGKLVPLSVAREAINALREIYESSYALVDASIDNLLVDRDQGLKLFDFEFSHRYEQAPERFEKSYDVAGCPADFSGDLPIQGCNSYDRNWRPYVGLSLHSLLNDPPWLQRAKRALYFTTHAHRFLPRLARGLVRAVLLRRPRQDHSILPPQPLEVISETPRASSKAA